MLLKNLQKGITTEMRGGEIRKNQNDIITNLVLAARGDKEFDKRVQELKELYNIEFFAA